MGDLFRWEAVSGQMARFRSGTMPRSASPCGACIERGATQLMRLPERFYPAARIEPRIFEVLLVPFLFRGTPVGTVWIVAHDGARQFDRHDERVVSVLTGFASAGWQLWKAREAAEQAGRRKDAFLATLGHELRNPLGAIVNASSILTRAHAGGENALAARAAGVVTRQSQQLTRMVNDLLDVSRLGQSKLTLDRQRVEVRGLCTDTVEASRALIERYGHRLSIELPAAPIWLEGDPVRLAQVLTNLLDNAAKYTPDRGEIRLSARQEGGEVHISVRDSGVGIPREQLESIFNMFEQVGSSLGRSAGGLGIGLALVRRLTELHGGAVVAQSAGPGQGSEFTVRLPVLLPPVGNAPGFG